MLQIARLSLKITALTVCIRSCFHLTYRSNVAMLHVYYKEQTGMRYRTDIRYGIEDFICNFVCFAYSHCLLSTNLRRSFYKAIIDKCLNILRSILSSL